MKWGVRKDRRKSGSGSGGTSTKKSSSLKGRISSARTTAKRKKSMQAINKQKKLDKKTNNPKKMSDAELQKRIERLELEKKYRSLNSAQLSEGKKIVKNMLSKSAENIGTQLTTYIMGEAVNKAFQKFMKEVGKETKENIVNPRKGQKDK